MQTQDAYNTWAKTYDEVLNKTRDVEAHALRLILSKIEFANCLEIGCGTGKNTTWFIETGKQITAVDLSEEMLAIATKKITSNNVVFVQADITNNLDFVTKKYDLVSFSLVLEHIQNLNHIFKQAVKVLNTGGKIYIGELHPFKQYTGSKARFETENGTQIVECFTHHLSDFINAAKNYGLALIELDEHFDDENNNEIPRIVTMVFEKK